MKKIFPYIFLLITSFIFFYQTILFFRVPFPGDLLISEYSPFKYESYLGYNPGSYPNKAQYFDTIQQLYPWKMFAVEEIKNGRFPLWNPYSFSGSPFFANNQSSVLNPFNILFLIFNSTVAWSIFIYLQPLLASVFTYLYLRKIKLSTIASIFGSIAFSYSLFMSVFLEYGNIGYSFIYLPLLLFLIEKVSDNIKTKFGILIPIVVGATFFSGHLQISGGIFIFSIIYSLARTFKLPRKTSVVLVFYHVLGLGVSMIQLVPTFELISNSARVSHEIAKFKNLLLIQLNQLVLFISPDTFGNPATRNYMLEDSYPGNAIYIGSLPTIFSIFSVFYFRKNLYVKYFSISSIILLIVLTNNIVSNQIYNFNLPFISSSSPANFIFLLSFSLCVLSAFGLDYWQKKFNKKIFYSIIIIAIFIASGFFLNKILSIEFLEKQFLLGIIIFGASSVLIIALTIIKKAKLAYLLLMLLVGDLLYYFLKFNPFVPANIIYPESKIAKELKKSEKVKSWGYSSANIEPNISVLYGFDSPEGYDPLYPFWYGQYLSLAENGKLLNKFDITNRSLASIKNGYGEKDLRENNYRQKILEETGVGIILSRRETPTSEYTFDSEKYKKIKEFDGWSMFKNLRAKQFAYLTSDVDTYQTNQEFEKKFFEGKNLLLKRMPNLQILNNDKPGEIIKFSDNIDNLSFTLKANSNTILAILQTYYPGWKAFVDGKEVEIIRANYAFNAIPVERGDHTVLLRYQPGSFHTGLIITIISSIISLIFCVVLVRSKK